MNQCKNQNIKTLFDIRFSVDQKFMDLFKEAVLVLSAKHPCGVSSEVLFREALECLLDKSPKRREERRLKRSQKRQGQKSLNIEKEHKSPSRGSFCLRCVSGKYSEPVVRFDSHKLEKSV